MEANGVEVTAEVEPEPEPVEELEATEPVVAAEPELVADAEGDSPELLLLPVELAVAELLVPVALALVSVGVLLPEEAEVVSTGGNEMGWPAAEHSETTTLDTAGTTYQYKTA